MEEVNNYLVDKQVEAIKMVFDKLVSLADLLKGFRKYLDKDKNGKDEALSTALENSQDRKMVSADKKTFGETTLDEVSGAKIGKNYKLDSIDIKAEKSVMKSFDEFAKKHGVSYGILKKDPSSSRVTVMFRAKDAQSMSNAFKAFVKAQSLSKSKPSLDEARAKAKSKVPLQKEKKTVRRDKDAR